MILAQGDDYFSPEAGQIHCSPPKNAHLFLMENNVNIGISESINIGKRSKKAGILERWGAGERDLRKLAREVESKPSYVASVLQAEGLLQGYHDLYTASGNAMNVYDGIFAGRLGYKDVKTAERGVTLIDRAYRELEAMGDRAGQHHCMVAALTMCNRARFSGKPSEGLVYRRWLLHRLTEPLTAARSA
jgi:hypothetical protein